MALNDRPNLMLTIAAFLVGVLLATDAGCDFGVCFNSASWVPPVTFGAFGLAFALAWNWVSFQRETHRLWRNTASTAMDFAVMETAKSIQAMTPEQLEIWLHKSEADAYIRVLQSVNGQDPAIIEQVIARLSDNLDRSAYLAEKLQRAASTITGTPGSGSRWYAMDAIKAAKLRSGFVPALRSEGEGTEKRTALEAFYRALAREPGVIEPAAGPKPAKILDYERATEIANRMRGHE